MKVNKLLKKRVSLFQVSFVFILFMVILSLVFINNSDFVNQNVEFDKTNLQIIYKKNEKNAGKSSVPMSFQQGIEELDSDLIEIVNKSDLSTSFLLCVQQVDTSSNDLSTDKLYYYVEGEGGILGDTDGCIYSGKIKGKETIQIDLKIWPGKDLIKYSDQGKKLNLKFILK